MNKRALGGLMLGIAILIAGAQIGVNWLRLGRSAEWGPLQQAALGVAGILALLALPLLWRDGRPA
ncbi:hypothetical protein [Thermoflexus sp.]|uniref:hypothetical protein n=1 Tax=Thermoflexus sp. TaxID=1969742 RepID=UPI0025CBB55B|nr:hypothetical protein [Thermoflexus sp.]MDW8181660.1 hypothetical protein [Anaerolineae bacterium]MCS6963528.1 hypothetical protein [Thermoflexus sp.]MCS7352199.1 hypothetical protein [Thermoflexus sp.]MCX7690493.1 hypothetical protein [Thermoflexus sp.]MDW8185439.1 hypothetical protein [Anaerolineae bacterium]